MRVLHDYQIIVRQKIGGISRYHYELIKNINEKIDGVEASALCLFFRNIYFREYYGRTPYSYSNKAVRNSVLIINDIYTFFKIIFASLAGKKYDIVHISWYNPYYARLIKKLMGKKSPKIVMTVHDLVHEMEANKNLIMKRGALAREKMLKIADAVIAISENTKKDLLHYYPWVDLKKISVIYHGFLQNKVNEACAMVLPQNYVFYVGKRSSYKNFKTFIFAMGQLKKRISDLYILCAGGGSFTKEELQYIKEYGLKDSIKQKNMTDAELVYCYAHAKCYVYPSLYEGFGMPILEAFYYCCPVVLSDASCFPEIAGDAGVYFNGENAEDMAAKVEMVYNMSNMERAELIEKGKKRLCAFSWERAAKETVEVYKKAEAAFIGKL